jgi:hypothetical protein
MIFVLTIVMSAAELKVLESKAILRQARFKLAELLHRPELAEEADNEEVVEALLTSPPVVWDEMVSLGLHRPFFTGDFTYEKMRV